MRNKNSLGHINKTDRSILCLSGALICLCLFSLAENTQLYGTTKLNRERELGFTVHSVKFFEGGSDCPEDKDKHFDNQFQKSTARYIRAQLNVTNNLYNVRDQHCTITFNFYRVPGPRIGKVDSDLKIKSEWQTAWLTADGWGWKDPGNWELGTYNVIAIVDDREIGRGTFTINAGPPRNTRTMLTNGVYSIKSAASGKCLDADENNQKADGCKIQLWNYQGGQNQEWGLENSHVPAVQRGFKKLNPPKK